MHTSHGQKATIKLSVCSYREKFAITFIASNSSPIDALKFSNQLFSNRFPVLCSKITRNMFSSLLSAFDTSTVSGGVNSLVECDSSNARRLLSGNETFSNYIHLLSARTNTLVNCCQPPLVPEPRS